MGRTTKGLMGVGREAFSEEVMVAVGEEGGAGVEEET